MSKHAIVIELDDLNGADSAVTLRCIIDSILDNYGADNPNSDEAPMRYDGFEGALVTEVYV